MVDVPLPARFTKGHIWVMIKHLLTENYDVNAGFWLYLGYCYKNIGWNHGYLPVTNWKRTSKWSSVPFERCSRRYSTVTVRGLRAVYHQYFFHYGKYPSFSLMWQEFRPELQVCHGHASLAVFLQPNDCGQVPTRCLKTKDVRYMPPLPGRTVLQISTVKAQKIGQEIEMPCGGCVWNFWGFVVPLSYFIYVYMVYLGFYMDLHVLVPRRATFGRASVHSVALHHPPMIVLGNLQSRPVVTIDNPTWGVQSPCLWGCIF